MGTDLIIQGERDEIARLSAAVDERDAAIAVRDAEHEHLLAKHEKTKDMLAGTILGHVLVLLFAAVAAIFFHREAAPILVGGMLANAFRIARWFYSERKKSPKKLGGVSST